MKDKHKYSSVYSDKDRTLYAIPCGWNPEYQTSVSIDILDILSTPYDQEILESFLLMSMDKCYSEERADADSIGVLEKHFGVKRWTTAVKGKKLVTFFWNYVDGYQMIPTIMKAPKDGFSPLMDKRNVLGFNPPKGAIAEAFLKAMNESVASR